MLDVSAMEWSPMHAYEQREIRSSGLRTIGDWRIKCYAITLDEGSREADFGPAWPLVAGTLPAEARTSIRPGVALVIEHAGRGTDYFVVAWWDLENELPLRIWVREHGSRGWRPARGSESVCVWDLEVLAFEREEYVRHVLASDGAGLAAYLKASYRPRSG